MTGSNNELALTKENVQVAAISTVNLVFSTQLVLPARQESSFYVSFFIDIFVFECSI